MILNSFRSFIRDIDRRTWLVVLLLGILGFILVSVPVTSHADVANLQVTIDAAATQTNIPLAILASNLTRTPMEYNLTGAAPTVMSFMSASEISQFAASARADSEKGTLEWSAAQAAGPPNTKECGDMHTAWSTSLPNSTGQLILYYAQLVTPSSIRVYQTFNPGFITRIDVVDIYGDTHTVYQGAAGLLGACPFELIIPISDADYAANTIVIYLDQTRSLGGWSAIDAVELIGVSYN